MCKKKIFRPSKKLLVQRPFHVNKILRYEYLTGRKNLWGQWALPFERLYETKNGKILVQRDNKDFPISVEGNYPEKSDFYFDFTFYKSLKFADLNFDHQSVD